jgi:hypothetical protein
MEILRGEEAKAFLDTINWTQGAPISEESAALKAMSPGEVLLITDHDVSDGHDSTHCSMAQRLRQAGSREWGKGVVAIRHGSTIAIHRKEIKNG